MRLLIEDYLGDAPQVQLSRSLASRGHDVLHLYSTDAQRPKADLVRLPHDPANFVVEGIGLGSKPSRSFFGKRRQEAAFGRRVIRRAARFQPDVFLSCNNPLGAQRHIQSFCTRMGIRHVYWLQDFCAEQIDRTIDQRPKVFSNTVSSYYHWLERSLMQRADALVLILDDYLGLLAETWGIPSRHCMVVHDWFPLDRVMPREKSNPWSRRVGIADKKVALYTGSLDPTMEDPLLLVRLAERLGSRPDLMVVVVSDGAGADFLRQEAQTRHLDNVLVLPYQPYEDYEHVLASADVLLAIVAETAGVLYIPSKTTSLLCAGRPIVMAANWRSVATSFLRQSKAGRVVPPEDVSAMADAILTYMDDANLAEQTGQQARVYAEQTFDISKITDQFERLFERLCSGPARQAHLRKA